VRNSRFYSFQLATNSLNIFELSIKKEVNACILFSPQEFERVLNLIAENKGKYTIDLTYERKDELTV